MKPTNKIFLWWCVMALMTFAGTAQTLSQQPQFKLAPVYTDNMVLQQNQSVPIWGQGKPGTAIIIRTSWGKKVTSVVQPDSNWVAKLPVPKAGGPFQISIQHDKSSIVIRNILAGEVWLCSGQSNMEMPLEGWAPSSPVMNSASEIEQALYPTIRIFSVKRNVEVDPSNTCVGSWSECSPADVPSFSAAAFYFGKTLNAALKVPIGLINTSYGGTPIEAWMSKEALKPFSEFTNILKLISDSKDSLILRDKWTTRHPSISINDRDPSHKWEGLKFGDDNCAARDFSDSTWQEMKLPTKWEMAAIGEFDGAVWFRKKLVVPNSWVGKDLVLQLGPVDDMDETFVNGKSVGKYLSEGCWQVDRVYKIPGSIIKDSLLQIAVRVLDIQGGGGIWGNGTKMVLYKDTVNDGISLESNWKYLPVAELRSNIFYVFGAKGNEFQKRPKVPIDFSSNTPTSLFNAMINPLLPFTIKGAIWYQGENNASNGHLYARLLPAMIANWRKVFSSGDFPFYFAQIAPFDYGTETQSQYLREAQMQTLSDKNTGMAVLLDIGDPKNIHPANKEDVGKRLALWALAKTYGKKIVCSGPLYKSMKAVKGKIVLSFDYAGKGLVIKEHLGANNFTIAGEDKVFKKAAVKVEGTKLVVSSPEIAKPAAVRYAWSNIDKGTLFNNEGLPASSFRTDTW